MNKAGGLFYDGKKLPDLCRWDVLSRTGTQRDIEGGTSRSLGYVNKVLQAFNGPYPMGPPLGRPPIPTQTTYAEHVALLRELLSERTDLITNDLMMCLDRASLHLSHSNLCRLLHSMGCTFRGSATISANKYSDENIAYTEQFLATATLIPRQHLKVFDIASLHLDAGERNDGWLLPGMIPTHIGAYERGPKVSLGLMTSLTDPAKPLFYQMLDNDWDGMDVYAFFEERVLAGDIGADDVVLMDNGGTNTAVEAELGALFTQVDASLLYLPSYAPEFSPAELTFNLLRERLRAQRRTPTSRTQLRENITAALSTISWDFMDPTYQHCGWR